jgi:hypothetical protein
MARLLSGKIKVTPYAGLSTDRYEFIQLSETEPNAGLPGVDGYVLASDTNGNRFWRSAPGASAINGLTIKDEGSIVGTADSVSSLNFVGNNVVATASGFGATVTVSDTPTFTNLAVTGVSTFQANVDLGDDDRLRFGDGNDLQIYHDSATNISYINESGSGRLEIRGSDLYLADEDGTNMLYAANNAGVSLYYGGGKRFETTAYGVNVTGTTDTDGLIVSGVSTFTGNIIAATASFSGNVSIAGTLTYEDVTNVDSLGIVTARSGVEVGPLAGIAATLSSDGSANFDGNLNVVGVTTLSGLKYPTSDGTTGQVLQTNGSGVLSFADVTGGSDEHILPVMTRTAQANSKNDAVMVTILAGINTVTGRFGSNVNVTENGLVPFRETVGITTHSLIETFFNTVV